MNSKLNLIVLIMGQVLSMRRGRNILARGMDRLNRDRNGFGMNELLGIAAALIIAAFVIIPGFKTFAGTLIQGLSEWWRDTISKQIFPTA